MHNDTLQIHSVSDRSSILTAGILQTLLSCPSNLLVPHIPPRHAHFPRMTVTQPMRETGCACFPATDEIVHKVLQHIVRSQGVHIRVCNLAPVTQLIDIGSRPGGGNSPFRSSVGKKYHLLRKTLQGSYLRCPSDQKVCTHQL